MTLSKSRPSQEEKTDRLFFKTRQIAQKNPAARLPERLPANLAQKAAKDEGKNKAGSGGEDVAHFMLVVAERASNDGIHLIFMDGLPGDISADWMAQEPIFVTENRTARREHMRSAYDLQCLGFHVEHGA